MLSQAQAEPLAARSGRLHDDGIAGLLKYLAFHRLAPAGKQAVPRTAPPARTLSAICP
jgi:hypothetical protein